jgi:hypothetical protein
MQSILNRASVKVSLVVTRVRSGPWGGAIFSGRSATGDAIKCIANFDKILRPPAPGELWEIAVEMKRHPN